MTDKLSEVMTFPMYGTHCGTFFFLISLEFWMEFSDLHLFQYLSTFLF